jgi:plasmid maintenance system antidote protein VapI
MEVIDLALELEAHRPRDVSKAEWARRAGYTPAQVGNFVKAGKNITIQSVIRLAAALGLRVTVAPLDQQPATTLLRAARDLEPWQRSLVDVAIERLLSPDPMARARVEGALAAVLQVQLPDDERQGRAVG